jgi:hypothetical protein
MLNRDVLLGRMFTNQKKEKLTLGCFNKYGENSA